MIIFKKVLSNHFESCTFKLYFLKKCKISFLKKYKLKAQLSKRFYIKNYYFLVSTYQKIF